MNQEQIDALNQRMSLLGFSRDENGYFSIVPDRLMIDSDLWEKLTEQETESFLILDSLYEEFYALCLEEYVSRFSDILRKEETLASLYRSEELSQYLSNNIRIAFSRDDLLDMPVFLNLGLNVDAFSDYTLNVTYPAYDWEEYEYQYKGHFHESSIMWLTRRQGYSQKELRKAQRSIEKASHSDDRTKIIPSPYLFSAANEIWCELCIGNQLGFFVKVPLREALLMRTMQRWGKHNQKWPGYVLLDRSTTCGFFDTFLGSCSYLGIEMERDVKIPLCDVDVFVDGTRGYALYDICETSSLWQPGKILRWGLPRRFRREAASLGVRELPPIGKVTPGNDNPVDKSE